MVRLSLFLLCVLWQTANGYEWLPNRSIRPHSYTYRSALHTQAGSFSLKGSINSENLLVKIEGTDRDGDGKVGNNVNNNSIESSQNEMKEMSSWFARGLLIFVSALYGTNFGIVKILETNLDAGIAAASRFTLAAAIFAPALYRLIKIKPELIKGGLEVGAYCSIAYWGQANALETTSSSTAAFICSLAVVVVPILESLFGQKDVIKSKQEKLTLFLPAALAVAGVGCLELGGSQMPQVGDAWALLQPIFFGMGFWRAEKHMRMATQAGDAQAFTGAMMLFIAAFSWVWATNDNILPLLNFADSTQVNSDRVMGMLQQQGSAMMDWHVIAALLWTGLVTTAFTSFVENIGESANFIFLNFGVFSLKTSLNNCILLPLII